MKSRVLLALNLIDIARQSETLLQPEGVFVCSGKIFDKRSDVREEREREKPDEFLSSPHQISVCWREMRIVPVTVCVPFGLEIYRTRERMRESEMGEEHFMTSVPEEESAFAAGHPLCVPLCLSF